MTVLDLVWLVGMLPGAAVGTYLWRHAVREVLRDTRVDRGDQVLAGILWIVFAAAFALMWPVLVVVGALLLPAWFVTSRIFPEGEYPR